MVFPRDVSASTSSFSSLRPRGGGGARGCGVVGGWAGGGQGVVFAWGGWAAVGHGPLGCWGVRLGASAGLWGAVGWGGWGLGGVGAVMVPWARGVWSGGLVELVGRGRMVGALGVSWCVLVGARGGCGVVGSGCGGRWVLGVGGGGGLFGGYGRVRWVSFGVAVGRSPWVRLGVGAVLVCARQALGLRGCPAGHRVEGDRLWVLGAAVGGCPVVSGGRVRGGGLVPGGGGVRRGCWGVLCAGGARWGGRAGGLVRGVWGEGLFRVGGVGGGCLGRGAGGCGGRVAGG